MKGVNKAFYCFTASYAESLKKSKVEKEKMIKVVEDHRKSYL